jgi:hypothetical protein
LPLQLVVEAVAATLVQAKAFQKPVEPVAVVEQDKQLPPE